MTTLEPFWQGDQAIAEMLKDNGAELESVEWPALDFSFDLEPLEWSELDFCFDFGSLDTDITDQADFQVTTEEGTKKRGKVQPNHAKGRVIQPYAPVSDSLGKGQKKAHIFR